MLIINCVCVIAVFIHVYISRVFDASFFVSPEKETLSYYEYYLFFRYTGINRCYFSLAPYIKNTPNTFSFYVLGVIISQISQ